MPFVSKTSASVSSDLKALYKSVIIIIIIIIIIIKIILHIGTLQEPDNRRYMLLLSLAVSAFPG